jgi:hypothetical protein
MIIYLFHPLFRLFAVIALGVQDYAIVNREPDRYKDAPYP